MAYDDEQIAKSYSELIKSGEIKDINDLSNFSDLKFTEHDPLEDITPSSLAFKESSESFENQVINNLIKIYNELTNVHEELIEIRTLVNQLKD